MNGRLLVQCDWDQSYRDGTGSFWISYKNAEQPAVHSHVRVTKRNDGKIILTADLPAFNISQHTSSQLSVGYYENGVVQASTTFRAPTNEFHFHGKNKKVTCLDISEGGLGLSCAENSSIVKVWETQSGTVRRELRGHVGDVYRAKFFPSGLVVLSGGADTQLKIWSVETGDCAATLLGHKAGVLDFEFVERGRNIVSCSRDGTIRLWDVSEQHVIHSYGSDTGHGIVNACTLRQTEAFDLQEVNGCSGDSGEVGTEKKLLLAALELGKIVGYGLASKQKLVEVASPDASAVNCVTFLTDESFVAGTQGGSVTVYDLRNLSSAVKSWSTTRSAVLSVTPYKQGFLYSTGDGSAVCVDETLSQSYEFTGADCDPIYQLRRGSNRVYSCCRDGAVRVYL
ncbi:proteasomal ATPase-associated factor 1-like [Watersipora subatra]|uniref:proteasomal ATPase-associated factor 1-like n=1 Tax=Watersipora subatra TaxID=2589382 RepID=UPI00355C3802